MKTPLPVLAELEKYKELADVPAGMLRETADVLTEYAALLRREYIYRESMGVRKFKGPDPKPKAKEKKGRR